MLAGLSQDFELPEILEVDDGSADSLTVRLLGALRAHLLIDA